MDIFDNALIHRKKTMLDKHKCKMYHNISTFASFFYSKRIKVQYENHFKRDNRDSLRLRVIIKMYSKSMIHGPF